MHGSRAPARQTWEDPSLVQLWGPRYSAYVVAAPDVPIFTLGRLPEDARSRAVADDIATRLSGFLAGRRSSQSDAARGIRARHPNVLRYAAPTGTVLMRWDGAREPTLWSVPAPDVDPHAARLELARRYLHVFGPTTAGSFAGWAGISPASGRATFAALARSLTPVRTPVGDAWILSSDEQSLHDVPHSVGAIRLLPSGDTYFLLQGADRSLLVPDPRRSSELWTSRVWPGAVLVDGEIVGTWRRASADVTIQTWRRLTRAERDELSTEAETLPLPGLRRAIRVRWL